MRRRRRLCVCAFYLVAKLFSNSTAARATSGQNLHNILKIDPLGRGVFLPPPFKLNALRVTTISRNVNRIKINNDRPTPLICTHTHTGGNSFKSYRRVYVVPPGTKEKSFVWPMWRHHGHVMYHRRNNLCTHDANVSVGGKEALHITTYEIKIEPPYFMTKWNYQGQSSKLLFLSRDKEKWRTSLNWFVYALTDINTCGQRYSV